MSVKSITWDHRRLILVDQTKLPVGVVTAEWSTRRCIGTSARSLTSE